MCLTKTNGMHLLWILFVIISFLEARKWYQVIDQHLAWSENQKHCQLLIQNFDFKQPEEALKCITNHSKVRKVPRLKTGMPHCTQLIASFKPENWIMLQEEVQSEIIHCIVDRILTHELSDDFISEEKTFAGQNAVIWRKRKDL